MTAQLYFLHTQKDTLPEVTQVFLDDNTPTTHIKPRLTMPHTMPGAENRPPVAGLEQALPSPPGKRMTVVLRRWVPQIWLRYNTCRATPPNQTFNSYSRVNQGSNQRSPALRASARPLYYDVGYPNTATVLYQ